MVQARRAGRGRRSAFALPGIQADVMVVATGRNERGLGAVALDQLKAEHAAIEVKRAVEIGDLQMDMADPDAGIDRAIRRCSGGIAGCERGSHLLSFRPSGREQQGQFGRPARTA